MRVAPRKQHSDRRGLAIKFHWGDFLDREGGHWQITPNAERGRYWAADCATLDRDTRIVTVGVGSENLDRLADLEALEEITLHETNQDQIDRLPLFGQIRRLRITHARPKTIAALARLPHVEELVLEYVSGFSDIAPLADMPALRAVHLENLRRVHDFSPLGDASGLRYLAIHGTFDWPQPMDSLAFAARLDCLEYLSVVGRLADPESAKALVAIGEGCAFHFADNLLPLELYAYLEAHCEKANFAPVVYRYMGPEVTLPAEDPRARMTDDQIRSDHPEILICADGMRRLFNTSEWDKYHLLGRGARDISVKDKKAAEKAAAYEKKYRDLVEAARKSVGS